MIKRPLAETGFWTGVAVSCMVVRSACKTVLFLTAGRGKSADAYGRRQLGERVYPAASRPDGVALGGYSGAGFRAQLGRYRLPQEAQGLVVAWRWHHHCLDLWY
jgi:hypothetical protein